MGQERDRLVEDHLELVRSIAGKLKRSQCRTLDMDDLVAYGCKGLIEAAGRFDARMGASFTTFAYYRIRGAMLDGMRSMSWYSRADLAHFRAEERANEYLQSQAERPAGQTGDAAETLDEIAEILGGVAAVHITSLEAAAHATDERLPPPDEQLQVVAMQARARKAMEKLPERERRMIQLHYFEGRNIDEVSREMGLSKSWGSRLHTRAVNRLREILEGEETGEGGEETEEDGEGE
jgi:RNA polymerase sigma factor for flagellar operon FliA